MIIFSKIVKFEIGISVEVPTHAQDIFSLFFNLIMTPIVWGIKIIIVSIFIVNPKKFKINSIPSSNSKKGYIIPNLKNFWEIGSYFEKDRANCFIL